MLKHLNSNAFICHYNCNCSLLLKYFQAKTQENFVKWVEQLKQHRLYRQHLLTFGTRDVPTIRAQDDDSPSVPRASECREIIKLFDVA